MKQTLVTGLIIIAVSITGCTVNLGESNNAPAANSAPTAANKPANAPANPPAAGPKKVTTGSKNPDSATVVKPGTTRVQFARGETSTYVTKDIPAKGSMLFLFNVQKGQTVDYTVAYDFDDSDVTVYMGEPGDQDASMPSATKAPQSFVVKRSGDHMLDVSNTTGKKITVTLYLDAQ